MIVFVFMRQKSQKSKFTSKKKARPKTETALKIAAATELPSSSPPTVISAPPPDVLEQWAEEEPDLFDLGAYFGAMRTLRSKGFSYREIAEWLTDHGVQVDHNTVYRVYTRNLSDHEARMEEQEVDREAEEEAMRNR